MQLTELVKILLYIIPGFLTMSIYSSRYPGIKDTDFGRMAMSIFYSVLNLLIVSKSCELLGKSFDLNSTKIQFSNLISLYFSSYILGYIFIFKKFLFIKLKYRFPRFTLISPNNHFTIWRQINKDYRGRWVNVFLKSGYNYVGWIKHWRFDPNLPSDYDFMIADAKLVDKNLRELRVISGVGVHIKSTEVSHIEIL